MLTIDKCSPFTRFELKSCKNISLDAVKLIANCLYYHLLLIETESHPDFHCAQLNIAQMSTTVRLDCNLAQQFLLSALMSWIIFKLTARPIHNLTLSKEAFSEVNRIINRSQIICINISRDRLVLEKLNSKRTVKRSFFILSTSKIEKKNFWEHHHADPWESSFD